MSVISSDQGNLFLPEKDRGERFTGSERKRERERERERKQREDGGGSRMYISQKKNKKNSGTIITAALRHE